MIKRWESKYWEILVALVQGKTLQWISDNIMGGISRQAVQDNLKRLGLGGAKKLAAGGRNLTNHHSLRSEGLFICRCGEIIERASISYHPMMCRKCNAARSYQYWHTHPETRRRQKEWKQNHPDKVREYQRRWFSKPEGRAKKSAYRKKYLKSAAYREWYDRIGRQKAHERYLRKKK